MKFLVRSSYELVEKIWELIEQNISDRLVVGLEGDLGAGKTTLVKGIARKMSIEDTVNSPTFNIAKLYHVPAGQRFAFLYHIDLYRLEKPSNRDLMEFSEQISEPKTLTLIEWVGNSQDLSKKVDCLIKIKAVSDNEREVEVLWK